MGLKKELKYAFEEHIYWCTPQVVGTAGVYYVERMHTYPRTQDRVCLQLGSPEKDITAFEDIYGVPGEWDIQKGAVVEVYVKKPHSLFYGELGGPAECLVAIRPFRRDTFGMLEPDGEALLELMFDHFNNRLKIWDSRAFFRKFLDANVPPIRPEDVMNL